MSTETNKRMARAFLESFDKGDFDAWRGAMAPGMVAHINGSEQAMNAAEFEGMVRVFAEAFASGRHIIHGQVAEGDWVATRLTWTAVHVGVVEGHVAVVVKAEREALGRERPDFWKEIA